MRFVILAASLIAKPTAAQTQQQFDLICQFGSTPVRYRLDLSTGEACKGECEQVWTMGAVTDAEIRIMDTPANSPEAMPQVIVINRRTGVLDRRVGGAGRPIQETAKCEPAPFSGFPPRRF